MLDSAPVSKTMGVLINFNSELDSSELRDSEGEGEREGQ